MSKAVLIDGLSILNRAFYGVPDLTNSEGLHTNAVYGFLNIMFKIIDEEQPDFLAVAFDVSAPTFRHKMFAEYKGTRKGMPDELRQQVPVMKEALAAMGVHIIEKEGYEADDIIGTMSRRCEAEGLDVSVISGDRDLLQLATKKVKVRIPKTKMTGTEIEDYYAGDVFEKYQVTPTEFIDLKALMGDASDNIPGVPGIGEKTATKIIVEYKSIENAHEHADQIKPKKASENLIAFWEQAQMSKVLARIDTDCPLDTDMKSMIMTDMYTPEAYLVFKRLEFKNILARFNSDALPKEQEIAPPVVVNDIKELPESIFKDRQIYGLYYHGQAPRGLCISTDDGAWFLTENEAGFGEIAAGLLAHGLLSFCNIKDSLDALNINEKDSVFDCSIAAYLLNPMKDSYDYDDIARDYLSLTLPGIRDIFGKVSHESFYNEHPEEFLKFVGWNAAVARIAYPKLMDALKTSEMDT